MSTEKPNGQSETQNPVGSSELLEANRAEWNACEDWSYKVDGQWTFIENEDGMRVTTFYRRLTYDEVYAFKAGWSIGWEHGLKCGKERKGSEIRQALGL